LIFFSLLIKSITIAIVKIIPTENPSDMKFIDPPLMSNDDISASVANRIYWHDPMRRSKNMVGSASHLIQLLHFSRFLVLSNHFSRVKLVIIVRLNNRINEINTRYIWLFSALPDPYPTAFRFMMYFTSTDLNSCGSTPRILVKKKWKSSLANEK
jgi:hypothetical protein